MYVRDMARVTDCVPTYRVARFAQTISDRTGSLAEEVLNAVRFITTFVSFVVYT